MKNATATSAASEMVTRLGQLATGRGCGTTADRVTSMASPPGRTAAAGDGRAATFTMRANKEGVLRKRQGFASDLAGIGSRSEFPGPNDCRSTFPSLGMWDLVPRQRLEVSALRVGLLNML